MSEHSSATDKAIRRQWAMWRLLVAALFLAGLFVTFKVAAYLIYEAEGYEAGAADCDDCGLTLLLDNIGWLALAIAAYFLMAFLAWTSVRRAVAKQRSA